MSALSAAVLVELLGCWLEVELGWLSVAVLVAALVESLGCWLEVELGHYLEVGSVEV